MAISGCLGFPGLWAGSRGDTFCGHLLFQPAATSASAAMRHSGVSFCCPYLYIERKRDPWVCSEMGYTLWKFNIANYGKSPFLMGKSTINVDFP